MMRLLVLASFVFLSACGRMSVPVSGDTTEDEDGGYVWGSPYAQQDTGTTGDTAEPIDSGQEEIDADGDGVPSGEDCDFCRYREAVRTTEH